MKKYNLFKKLWLYALFAVMANMATVNNSYGFFGFINDLVRKREEASRNAMAMIINAAKEKAEQALDEADKNNPLLAQLQEGTLVR